MFFLFASLPVSLQPSHRGEWSSLVVRLSSAQQVEAEMIRKGLIYGASMGLSQVSLSL